MREFQTLRSFLCLVLLASAAALAQTEIESIDFETIPIGTTFGAPQITLQGNTVVQGDLEVSGQLKLGAGATIVFDPPRAGFLVLDVGDFVPSLLTDSASRWWIGLGYHTVPDATSFGLGAGVAPAHLPSGATITGFRCWIYDNDPTVDFTPESGIVLYGRSANNVFGNGLFHVEGIGGAVQQDALIEVVDPSPISTTVNPTTAYFVSYSLGFTDSTETPSLMRFYGCRIDYEVSTWAP
jgi:hypothetical protein